MSHHERPRYVPVSTYRLQIHGGFPLTAARDVVPYLARLGVAAVYTSPYFAASPGSTHGYDVCNHNEINLEYGGPEAHEAFIAAAHAHGLVHLVDFVPNHMGIGTGANAWWNDVLENGPSSPSARFFDVDWTPVKEELHAKLLLPILGDQYGRVLERGELTLVFREGALGLRYFEHELPINPRQAPRVYRQAVEPLTEALGNDSPQLQEYLSIISQLENLPPYTDSKPERMIIRQREKEVARGRLARLVAESPAVGEGIDAVVSVFNGEAGKAETFDELHQLLEMQPYRLAYWRTAFHEINYRRFFDINTLAGLRVEDPTVFAHTHQLLKTLLADGKVQAVRIDHPDGLFDPARYFSMLQDLAAEAWNLTREPERSGRADRPLYVLAEKILSGREALPRRWAVHGTTGYNYLNDLNGLYVDTSQARQLHRAYAKLTGRIEPFDDVLYASKRLIIDTAMASELTVLTHMIDRIAQSSRRSRDFTRAGLREVITEVVACFPVYRTYVDEDGWTPEDRAVVERAIARARRRNPGDGSVALRLLPRSHDAARRRYRSAAQRPARRLSAADAGRRPRAAAVRHEAAAIHRTGAGERARRHGVLPLQHAPVGQRSRRRSRPLRTIRRRIPRSQPAAPAQLAARDADDRDSRHEARRRRAGPGQCDLRGVGRVDAGGRPMDAPEPRAAHADRR